MDASLKDEIARLEASINQHKTVPVGGFAGRGRGRNRGGYRGGYTGYGGYNSGYNYAGRGGGATRFANNKYVRPGLETTNLTQSSTSAPTTSSSTASVKPPSSSTFDFSTGGANASGSSMANSSTADGTKDVVIGGVAFESSSRSLVRKDLVKAKPISSGKPPPPNLPYIRKSGHLVASGRAYKPKSLRGRNLTLNNTRKSWRDKKRKQINKPCPRFTTTGSCNRGLTCMYQHDPSKIAICWNFLQDSCPNTAETCQLSHDPTPERTPICVHFLNKGRCTRGGCLFPHVNVGRREGVCRDFAVLGYCEKGLDCDKQHIRECPDFAENATCSTKGCKLPHVIRANRGRKVTAAAAASDSVMHIEVPTRTDTTNVVAGSSVIMKGTEAPPPPVYAEDGNLGDEYISLTFNESEDEDEEDSSDEEESEGEDNDNNDHMENLSGSENTDKKDSDME